MLFEELGLSEPILRAVSAAGYDTPTPIQSQAIPLALAGRDLLGCAQTGTGKTAAFALPILDRLAARETLAGPRRIRALILSPTRELALQIGDNFRAYGRHVGLRQTVVVGGVNQNPQTRALRKGVDILIATPGRLLDLQEQGYVDLRSVEILVLDEADRMLDMGFLPDVRRVLKSLPPKRQTLFFSATMPAEVRQLADAMLRDPEQIRVAPVKSTAELIEQSVYRVSREQKPRLLAELLDRWPISRALIFTRTKRGADVVTRRLGKAKIHAEAIHGNKSQAARQRTLDNFKSHRLQVLVATDLAARGIDVDNISHVVNYDVPETPESYVHRIGRTGRAGATGTAVTFCDAEEAKYLQAIERLLRRKLPVIADAAPAEPSRDEHVAREGHDSATPSPASNEGEATRRREFSPQPQATHAGDGRPQQGKRGKGKFRPRPSGSPAKARQSGAKQGERSKHGDYAAASAGQGAGRPAKKKRRYASTLRA